MTSELKYIKVTNFTSQRGNLYPELKLSYQVFGLAINEAPVIWVGHALTGNSNVAHPKTGWWKALVGVKKTIDTDRYSVICFNILGNGYDTPALPEHSHFHTGDIAKLQFLAMQKLGIQQLYAAIGGSVGGGILWELAVAYPKFINTVIPVASSWTSSSWVIASAHVQNQILLHSTHPIEDARQMAMLLYRTPQSFDSKFEEPKNTHNRSEAISWLQFHGQSLADRFELQAYKIMNQLMASIHVFRLNSNNKEVLQPLESKVIQIAIDTDILFHPESNTAIKKVLDRLGIENEYHEIESPHGHDAFLIEHQQIAHILHPIFN